MVIVVETACCHEVCIFKAKLLDLFVHKNCEMLLASCNKLCKSVCGITARGEDSAVEKVSCGNGFVYGLIAVLIFFRKDILIIIKALYYGIIEKKYNITPIKFLNTFRIINSKRLLESGDMYVSDVAQACGYNSNTSFTN